MKPKLMVIGHARHGKDSVCNILRDRYNFSFISSSYFVAIRAVQPYLEAKGFTYTDFDSMYRDRINHRADWHDAIAAYNTPDAARLGRELFAKYDIYCGIRSQIEFDALKAQKAFDVCIWVDASERCDLEPNTSNKLSMWYADYVINSNGPVENLERKVARVMRCIRVSFPE